MRVMIADDDLFFRKILSDAVRSWGYEPVIAANGNEAWDMLRQDGGPTLVILDWMMPGLEGVEICQRVRAQNPPNYIYIILLTSKSSPEDIVKGLESGADDYIVKPFNHEEFKSRLNIGRRIIELEQRILCLASHDYLTTLLNRRAFMERLEAEVNRGKREAKTLGLVIADIDHFKNVNDKYGHQAGDLVLQEFARALSSSFRIYDFIGRYGGEEFVVALPGANAEESQRIAERVRYSLEQHKTNLTDRNMEIGVTASFGITALQPGTPRTIDELINEADSALYQAKREGRNRVRVFNK